MHVLIRYKINKTLHEHAAVLCAMHSANVVLHCLSFRLLYPSVKPNMWRIYYRLQQYCVLCCKISTNTALGPVCFVSHLFTLSQ